MDVILLVLHVCLALGIITLVLLQKGKGAAEGATFGGAGSVFGARGSANFLSKSTAVFATLFFCNSIALAYMAANREASDSVVESFGQQLEQQLEQGATAVEDSLDDLIPAVDDAATGSASDDIPPPADAAGASVDVPPPAAD